MLITLHDDHRRNLQLLLKFDNELVDSFASLAIDFLIKGINQKKYHTAAQKLGVESSDIQRLVEALMYLYTEASRHMVDDADFRDTCLLTVGGSGGSEQQERAEQLVSTLAQRYMTHQAHIRRILAHDAVGSSALPHYHNLHWRLDVIVNSRSLFHQTTPVIVLKLWCEEGPGGRRRCHYLETDPTTLLHVTAKLDTALQQLTSKHTRGLMRHCQRTA